MERILVIDTDSSAHIANHLQKLFEGKAVVYAESQYESPREEKRKKAEANIETYTFENEIEKKDFDLIFVSATLIEEEKINLFDLMKEFGNARSQIVLMSTNMRVLKRLEGKLHSQVEYFHPKFDLMGAMSVDDLPVGERELLWSYLNNLPRRL